MENFLLWLGANAVKGSVVTLIIFLVLLLFPRKFPPVTGINFGIWLP